MTDETTLDDERAAALERAMAEAPVELAFELGRRVFTAADLAQLKRGDIVDLEIPIDSPVNLVVSGRVVGQGELVALEGRIGVRVLRLQSGERSQPDRQL